MVYRLKEGASMRNKVTERWNSYESFHVVLGDKKIADVVITNHAQVRYNDRIDTINRSYDHIAGWIWECLKQGRIKPYYRNEEDVYLIDEDIVIVCEFSELPNEYDVAGNSLHKMVIVTFLGKMSETIELRDLKSYYSWLRHSRRMTLMKNSRKHK